MKYLTRKWVEGGYDEQETQIHWHVYLRHLQDIKADLTEGVIELAEITEGFHVAGGRVAATSFSRSDGSFHLVLELAGHFLDIKYLGAEYENFDGLEAAKCVLSDEIDVLPDGRFEHRYLLEPDGEFIVTFSDVIVYFKPPGEDDE